MLTSRSNISQVKISRIAEVFRQANFKRIREFQKVILSVPFDSKSWPVFTWKFYLKFGGMVLQLCVLWMWDVTRWPIVPMSDLSLVIRSSSPPKSGRREEGPHYARTWSHRGRVQLELLPEKFLKMQPPSPGSRDWFKKWLLSEIVVVMMSIKYISIN